MFMCSLCSCVCGVYVIGHRYDYAYVYDDVYFMCTVIFMFMIMGHVHVHVLRFGIVLFACCVCFCMSVRVCIR